jgi:hypothetical protein
MNNHITNEQAIDALCIWEEVLHRCQQDDDTLYNWICAPEGAYQGRQNALELAPLLAAAWQQVQDRFDITFDWEFVPLALPLFAEKEFRHANTPLHADYVAKRIINKLIKEREPNNPQKELDLAF